MSGKCRTKNRVILPVLVMAVVSCLLPLRVHGQKDKKDIPEEIIRLSKLDREKVEFTISRDIFSPDPMKPPDPGGEGRKPTTVIPQPQPDVEEPKIRIKTPEERMEEAEEQTRREVSYEGYVIKESKSCALLTVNGELVALTEGDMATEKIKILQIKRNAISVEVPVKVTVDDKEEIKAHVFEIPIKGDEENEIQ